MEKAKKRRLKGQTAKRHLIGIGGVGMSALATALVKLGDTVTGSDRTRGTPNIRFLESLGVKVFPDDGSGIDAETDEVIVSTAIEETNPGLRKARGLGIPVTHRAKALARTLAGHRLVAVVGTCGKSTVTAMLGHVLAECGLDPLCVNGANVPGWDGAVRFGRGEYAVAEVDESDRSLVAFSPYAAIVTNASADHYSKEEMDAVFDAFVKGCKGPVVDGRKIFSHGLTRIGTDYREVNHGLARIDTDSVAGAQSVKIRDNPWLNLAGLEVPVPGRHNRQNAELAVRMAVALGVKLSDAVAAMKTFRGVERRLQLITPPQPPKPSKPPKHPEPAVYDDYAHNPEKLKAMWTTLAEKYPQGICAIWRPHGYAPLRKMKDALAAMFAETIRPQDRLLLLPVYDAGGTTDRSINSDALVAAVAHANAATGARVELVADLDAAYGWCAAHGRDFGCFVTCGARDPGLPVLARRLAHGILV